MPKIGQGSEIVLALSFAILSLFHKHKPENLANSAKSLMAIIIGTEDKPDKGTKNLLNLNNIFSHSHNILSYSLS